jgi:hypothetical protein
MQAVIGNWKSAAAASGPTPFDFVNPPQLVSASFSGSNWLSMNTGVTIGAGAYTVEGWAYFTSASLPGVMLSTLTASNSGFSLLIFSATEIRIDQNGVAQNAYTVPTMANNTWHHIAVTRDSSGNETVFVDGVRSSTGTTATNYNFSGASAGVGKFNTGGQWWFTGRFSNIRAVVGSNVYDPTASTITVPTSPLTAVANTAVLLSLGNTPFIDTTGVKTITNNSAVALVNSSPFPATWTDSVNGIVANVATSVNSTNNPSYDALYGGGIIILQTSESYVDVPTSYSGAAGFTISMAANIPAAQGSHYVAIFDGNTIDRTGAYINSRQWVGDGLEVGTQGVWGASNSVSNPVMGALAWWDFVYNGRFVSVYKNSSLVTGFNNYDLVAGNANAGWKNPLRFGGDESIAAGNMMWPGTLYRAKCQAGALTQSQITAQYNSIKSTYGLP